MAFYNQEYQNLLIAERVATKALQNPAVDNTDIASLARALVAVIQQKRIIRMKPNPKAVDVSRLGKGKRAAPSVQPLPPQVAVASPVQQQ